MVKGERESILDLQAQLSKNRFKEDDLGWGSRGVLKCLVNALVSSNTFKNQKYQIQALDDEN